MRVCSVHPGIELQQIVEATGFELIIDGTPPPTAMPTAEELVLLRTRVDRKGALRRGAA
jgi:glutaconate CoA-transferase subunit B